MTNSIEIREATVRDVQVIYRLNKEALGYDYPLEKTRQRIEYVLTQHRDKLYIAMLDGSVVGYVHGADYECTYVDSLKDVLALAVDQRARGRGVGKALMQNIEYWAQKTGASGVRLVSGMSRANTHQFYLACGYINTKDQKSFVKFF